MKKYLVGVLLVAGCASHKVTQINMPYEYIDNKVDHQLELTLTNNSSHTLCLTPEMWPNSKGIVMLASERVFLTVGTNKFAMEEYDGGYCPKCATAIKPKEKISAKISYDLFNLPESLVNEKKQLEFSPKAFECSE
jgi:hypothetical protein